MKFGIALPGNSAWAAGSRFLAVPHLRGELHDETEGRARRQDESLFRIEDDAVGLVPKVHAEVAEGRRVEAPDLSKHASRPARPDRARHVARHEEPHGLDFRERNLDGPEPPFHHNGPFRDQDRARGQEPRGECHPERRESRHSDYYGPGPDERRGPPGAPSRPGEAPREASHEENEEAEEADGRDRQRPAHHAFETRGGHDRDPPFHGLYRRQVPDVMYRFIRSKPSLGRGASLGYSPARPEENQVRDSRYSAGGDADLAFERMTGEEGARCVFAQFR